MTEPVFPAASTTKRATPLPLGTVGGVQRELAKLYKEARAGKLDVSDASKLAHILQILARTIEGSDLERRLEAIEEAQGKQG